jgi:hypothetical protein
MTLAGDPAAALQRRLQDGCKRAREARRTGSRGGTMTAMATRTSARSEDDLLAGVTSRAPMTTVDGLSNVPMERVVRDGRRYVVKWLSPELDWVMRFSDDEVCRPVLLWETGLYDEISAFVEHAVVDVCRDETTGRAGLLMKDLGEHFLPEGAAPFTLEQHEAFVRAMAAMHAGFWDWRDEVGLCHDSTRISLFATSRVEQEAARGPLTGVPAVVLGCWAELERLVPRTARGVRALVHEPEPLARALAETPRTLIHGDWKGGNLGLLPGGRPVLVDWAMTGEGAGLGDLAWYLAVNCDRLPVSKEDTVRSYRTALEGAGIATGGWFDRQLELALLGAFCMLGWSKTEDPVELRWWVDRVTHVAEELVT